MISHSYRFYLCLKVFITQNFILKSVCHVGSPFPQYSLLLHPLKYGTLTVPNYAVWGLTSQCKSCMVVINYKCPGSHFSSCFVQDRALTSPFMQDLLSLINFFLKKWWKANKGFKKQNDMIISENWKDHWDRKSVV